jgi:hypothetical protein
MISSTLEGRRVVPGEARLPRALRTIEVALVVFLATSAARAGPPFVTNDADPPGVGQWEINLPFTLDRAPDGSRGGEFATFDINYGYDRFTQLSIEVPLPYTREAGGETRSGIGDLLLEYKRRSGTDASAGYWGVNPQIALPSGSEERGLGAGWITADLPVIYQKQWGKALVYSDLRYRWRAGEEGKSFWFLGAAVEREMSARLTGGAELFGTTRQRPGGKQNAAFNVGLKYRLDRGNVLMLSAGRSLRGDPDLTLFLGWKVLTPPS